MRLTLSLLCPSSFNPRASKALANPPSPCISSALLVFAPFQPLELLSHALFWYLLTRHCNRNAPSYMDNSFQGNSDWEEEATECAVVRLVLSPGCLGPFLTHAAGGLRSRDEDEGQRCFSLQPKHLLFQNETSVCRGGAGDASSIVQK